VSLERDQENPFRPSTSSATFWSGPEAPGFSPLFVGREDADLLFVDGVPPETIYRFKHALIQERDTTAC
jgi:hypothetical protein